MTDDKKKSIRRLLPPSEPEPPMGRRQFIATDKTRAQQKASSRDKGTAPLKKNIGVKVDDQLWRHLRALALRQGRLTGELLDEAIEQYLKSHDG